MTNISNPVAPNCHHLFSKYTISTPQFVNITDNQCGYGCIQKFSRFPFVKKERRVNATKLSTHIMQLSANGAEICCAKVALFLNLYKF